MRRSPKINLLIVTLIFGLWSLQIDHAYAQSIEKPRIAINRTFVVVKNISKNTLKHLNLSQLLAEMEASLRATRKFEVLTRQKVILKMIRDEQKFAASDFAKGNAAQEGQLENVSYLVF